MTASSDLSAIEAAVIAFFAEHEVASLRLPSGWFGRPHDNWHQLTATDIAGDALLVRLDERQVLALDVEGASSEGREVLGPGDVEFHAPFHP